MLIELPNGDLFNTERLEAIHQAGDIVRFVFASGKVLQQECGSAEDALEHRTVIVRHILGKLKEGVKSE